MRTVSASVRRFEHGLGAALMALLPAISAERIPVPSWGANGPNVWRFWLLTVWPHRRPVLLIFACQTIAALAQVMMPYALSRVVKEVVVGFRGAGLEWPMLYVYLLGFVFAAVLDFYCTRLVAYTQTVNGPNIRQTATICFVKHLLHHSHRYIANHQTGYLTNKIMEASSALTDGLWIFMLELWPAIVVVTVSTLALGAIHPALGLAVLVWGLSFFAYAAFKAGRRHDMAKETSARRAKVYGVVNDVLTNLVTVKLFAQGRHEMLRLKKLLDDEDEAAVSYANETEKTQVALYFFASVFKVVLLLLAAWLMIVSDDFGVSHFVFLAFLTNVIISQTQNGSRRLAGFMGVNSRVQTAVGAILLRHEIVDAPDAVKPQSLRGSIEFRDVHFSYDGKREVFKGMSLTIPAGQRVGVVGSSGAGKSSFTNLLLRFYDVSKGAVLIDGIDIRKLPLACLYQQIAIIPQDSALFHRTVKENICYGKHDASEAEIIAAAQRGACHAFISELPQQYDTMVGERGVKLSGGQRQRIGIARAILKDAPILLMDEATSALDSITEAEVQTSLHNAMQDKTVIVVAHRLSTIKDLDRILVFDQGCLIEDGTHEDLLALRGQYFDLWSCQAGDESAAEQAPKMPAPLAQPA